jgi:hypothetical protein
VEILSAIIYHRITPDAGSTEKFIASRNASNAKMSAKTRQTVRIPPFGLDLRLRSQADAGLLPFGQEKGRKMSKLKLLYGELDEEVLASQATELQKAGHSVQTAIGRKAVMDLLKKESFDLIVLGQTLSRDDRHHLPYMAKKVQAGGKVLVLHTDGSRHPYVDGNTDTGEDMQHVLNKISAMYSQAKPESKPQQSKAMTAKAGR